MGHPRLLSSILLSSGNGKTRFHLQTPACIIVKTFRFSDGALALLGHAYRNHALLDLNPRLGAYASSAGICPILSNLNQKVVEAYHLIRFADIPCDSF